MQHETSIIHSENIKSGLTVEWYRSSAQELPDREWSVVCYSDESRWLFDVAGAEKLTLLGAVQDGLNTAEILESNTGSIVALYAGGIQSFDDREQWVESLPERDKPEAQRMLNGDESN